MILFLLLWAHQSGKPLHLDDVDHFGIATAIVETGRPVYYRGEDNPALSGALHPPLNDFLLAGWFVVFGTGVLQARSFAAVCALLHGAAALLLARRLYPRPTVAELAPWFWVLFLLNPFTLQMASMVDIDSSTYGPLLTLLLWSVVRLFWRGGARRIDEPRALELGLTTLLLTTCLWTKLTTVLLAIPFLFLFLLLRMRPVRALATAGVVTSAGIALFLATFWLSFRLWGLHVDTTIRFLYANATGGGRLASWTETLAFMTRQFASWNGILPYVAVATGLLACLGAVMRHRRQSESPAVEVLLILSLATVSTLYYCGSRVTFGDAPFKYTFAYYGVLTLPLAFLVAGSRAAATPLVTHPVSGRSTPPAFPLGERSRFSVYAIVLILGAFVALGFLRDSVIQ